MKWPLRFSLRTLLVALLFAPPLLAASGVAVKNALAPPDALSKEERQALEKAMNGFTCHYCFRATQEADQADGAEEEVVVCP
jgi:hypothetical protein